MRSLCLLSFCILTACNSSKATTDSVNTGAPNTNWVSNAVAQRRTDTRIQKLLNTKYRTPAQEAELKVLKKGGSAREALLAAKKYEKGLSDMEADELKYLEAGKSDREAELLAKEDNRKITIFEKRELDKLRYGTKTDENTQSSSSSSVELKEFSH